MAETPSQFESQSPEGTFGPGIEAEASMEMAGYNHQMAGYSEYMQRKPSRTPSYVPPAQSIINETNDDGTETADDDIEISLNDNETSDIINKSYEKFANTFGYNKNAPGGTHFGPTIMHDNDRDGLGCSICHLGTVDKDGNLNYCSGILTELPEFSFKINYTDGPGKTTLDFINQLFDNDLFKITNALGSKSDEFKNLIPAGSMTKEMYDGTSLSDINLKFRIYSNDTLGQSDVNSWKKLLSENAVVNTDNNITIQNSVENIKSALQNAKGIGSDLVKVFNNNKIIEESEKNEPDYAPNHDEQITKDIARLWRDFSYKIQENLINASYNLNIPNFKSNISYKTGTADNNIFYYYLLIEITISYTKTEDNTNWFEKLGSVVKDYLPGGDGDSLAAEKTYYMGILLYANNPKDKNYNASNVFNITENMTSIEPKQSKLSDLTGWVLDSDAADAGKFDKLKESTNSLTDIAKKLVFFDDDYKDESQFKEFGKNWYDFLTELNTNFAKVFYVEQPTPVEEDAKEFEDDYNTVMKFWNGLKAVSDGLQKILEQRYSFIRALQGFNKNNALGERLFILKLYSPFLFKKFLTVAVKNWEITQSKENGYYSDISITCGLDQIYSIEQWNNVLTDFTQIYNINKLI